MSNAEQPARGALSMANERNQLAPNNIGAEVEHDAVYSTEPYLIPGTTVMMPGYEELKAQAKEYGISTRRLRLRIVAEAQGLADVRREREERDGDGPSPARAPLPPRPRPQPSVVQKPLPKPQPQAEPRPKLVPFSPNHLDPRQQLNRIKTLFQEKKVAQRWLGYSAILAIALPVFLASIYFGLIASDQYVAEAQFAVRSSDGTVAPDLLGMMTGFAGSSTTSADSYILTEYVHSRGMLEELQRRFDLRGMYSTDKADYFARFKGNSSTEELLEYWRTMARLQYDATSGILTVRVKAFTPEDSLTIASAVLSLSEKLINDVSRRAREDGVRFAREELSRAELRLKFARKQIRDFRDREQAVDPSKTAEARMTILGNLQGELSKAEAEQSALGGFLSADAPTVRVLNTRIAALKKQIEDEQSKLGSTANVGKDGKVLSGVISEYEEIMVEQEFAQKAYTAAMAALERARIEADRQMRYVATFVEPRLPDEALYPQRLQSVLLVLLAASVLWCLGILMVYAVRDHVA